MAEADTPVIGIDGDQVEDEVQPVVAPPDQRDAPPEGEAGPIGGPSSQPEAIETGNADQNVGEDYEEEDVQGDEAIVVEDQEAADIAVDEAPAAQLGDAEKPQDEDMAAADVNDEEKNGDAQQEKKSKNASHTAAEQQQQPEDDADPMSLPPHGTEIFIGNIAHASTRDEIKEFCEKVAPVYKLHIPPPKMDGAHNPGYAFAMFYDRIAAAEAIESMANATMPSGPQRKLTVKYSSKQKHKLYVCNIPREKGRQELLESFRKLVVGIDELDVTTNKDQGRPGENRGFCFLEMYNQAAAEAAMETLTAPGVELCGMVLSPPLRVEWADLKGQEGSNNSEVKSLHISSLPGDVTEDALKEAFEKYAAIERIALLDKKGEAGKKRDYAFLHYEKRSTALKVLEAYMKDGVKVGGNDVIVSLAKPAQNRDRDMDRDRHGGGGYGDRRMGGGRGMDRGPRGGPGGPYGGGYDDWDGGRGYGGGPYGGGGGRGRDRMERDRFDGGGYGGERRMGGGMRDRERGWRGPHGPDDGYGGGGYDRRGPPGGGWGGGDMGYGGPMGGGGGGYDGYGGPRMDGRGDWGGHGGYDQGAGAAQMMPMGQMGAMPWMMMPDQAQGAMRMGAGGAGGAGGYDRAKPSTGGYGAARGGGATMGGGSTTTRGYGSQASAGYGGGEQAYGYGAPSSSPQGYGGGYGGARPSARNGGYGMQYGGRY